MWIKLPDMVAPCKGCTERTTEPNCHMHCDRYLKFREILNERKRKIQLENDINRPLMNQRYFAWKRMKGE